MKINKSKYLLPFFLSLFIGINLFSCKDDFDLNKGNDVEDPASGILRAEVSFDENGFVEPGTRTPVSPYDYWTIGNDRGTYTFTNGDTMGVFTRSGNLDIPGGGPLINIPMAFVRTAIDPNSTNTSTILENPNVNVYTGGMVANEVFMYYPYTPKMGNIDNYNPNNGYMEYGYKYDSSSNTMVKDNNPNTAWGVELRKKDPKDGILKCIDFIMSTAANASDLKKGVIRGTVYHAFSELIILRGEGFKNPKNENGEPDYTIKVVVSNPATHARITSYNVSVTGSDKPEMVRWNSQMYWDEHYTFEGHPFSRMDARTWEAWEGAPRTNNQDNEEYRAWYVVLPRPHNALNNEKTYGSQNAPGTSISYIELYDDEGYLQRVTSINLKSTETSDATKTPAMRYRYPIIIKTDEMGAVANPVTIDNWIFDEKNNDITEKRSAGISSETDYYDWVVNYNAYIAATDNSVKESYKETLFKYGNLINNVWEFYVTKSIKFSSIQPLQVNVLQDKIIGADNFNNVSLSNINVKYPLFQKITENGAIENLDFSEITIKWPAPESGNEVASVGCIAGIITRTGDIGGAQFKKCNIKNATVVSQGSGPVGIFAGEMRYGTISDSSFTGIIIGGETASEDYKNILGIPPVASEAPTLDNVNVSVTFNRN